jgi:hypothetical protein
VPVTVLSLAIPATPRPREAEACGSSRADPHGGAASAPPGLYTLEVEITDHAFYDRTTRKTASFTIVD